MRSLTVLAVVAACHVPDVDLSGRACPCIDGWTCDPATQTCVQRVAVDAAVDGAMACPGFFCDGFESGDTSRWSNTSVTPTATLVVETALAHSGSHGLDSTVPAIASGSIAAVVEQFPATSTGMIAVRAWFYLPQPVINFDSVITLVGAPDHYTTVDGDNTEHWTVTEIGTTGADHHSTAVAVQNTWLCLELDYSFGPAAIELYLDDVPVVDVAAVDSVPAFTDVRIGVSRADAAGARAVTDDVVIGTQHIGCD